MRRFRYLIALMLGAGLLLPGCGEGDAATTPTGVLHVTRGGTGSVFLSDTQESYAFADSVSVVVHSTSDGDDVFRVYTFFGLSRLNYGEVPEAVLATYIDGLDPLTSSSTEAPSNVVKMTFYDGFAASSRGIAAQDPVQTFERTSAGSFILEPQSGTDGGFTSQASSSRRARWETMTLVDSANNEEVLVQGAVNYDLSTNVSQEFYSYAGNLGVTTVPSDGGGGPPTPPGTSTDDDGDTSSTDSDGDDPPSAPY